MRAGEPASTWTLDILPGNYCVARGAPDDDPPPTPRDGFYSITRTRDETSVVCLEEAASADWKASDWKVRGGWRILQVVGVLDFSQIGVLAALSATLADAGVSIFALSTWDTDYLMLAATDLEAAVAALRAKGHQVRV